MRGSAGSAELMYHAGPAGRHRPAVAAVVCFATGICLDRFFPISMSLWMGLALAGMMLMLVLHWRTCAYRTRIASGSALLTLLFVGGARQHLVWHLRPVNDITAFSLPTPDIAPSQDLSPVRLTGIIANPIEILESKFGPGIPSWMEIDRSTCTLLCESLEQHGEPVPISGRVRMDVSGHLVHVRVGDRIQVLGQLTAPRHSDNPGGMDYGEFLQRQGISCILRVEHPVAVTRLEQVNSWIWKLARVRESIRNQCLQIFFTQLNAEQCGLASSLLIGDRTMLTDKLQDQFAQTGTMHLLAISGLHVGILIGLVLMLCRLISLSSRGTAAVVMLTVLAYVFVTDLRPPVLRAGLLAAVAVVGIVRGDSVDRMNALALSALILLIWHPADLFDIGAQLSFLAVGAILWSVGWHPRGESHETTLTDLLNELSPWRQYWKRIRKHLLGIYSTTTAVTLATLPVTMATFHLLAPVGLLLNIALIPYIGIVLSLGYLLMFGSLLLPGTAGLLAVPFRWSLWLLQWSVEWGQATPWGHLYVPAVSWWWLLVFYLLLAWAWQLCGTPRSARWGFKALLCWCVVGLLLPFLPGQRDLFRCTFLSVGHGLACVLEFPTGETVLYDAGTVGDGERATRAIANLLWSRGRSRIDAVIVSHADHDHFSGLFGLLEKFPVTTLFITSQFLDFQQQGVADLCELAASRGVSIQLLQAEDELYFPRDSSQAVRARVLYPPPHLSLRSDNASSLVLALEFASRRVLLTGDLEQEGLTDLLALPTRSVDILLSPHHGGKVANVLSLYEWSSPTYAVVSSKAQVLPALAQVPRSCTLLNTATSGAITFEIQPDGSIHVDEFAREQK